jgi:F-type H+-transporting ATPase subunit gamma
MSRVLQLKGKLNGISKINKMTKAMQIVAVSQLKRAQSVQHSAVHFKKHFDRLIKRLDITPRVLSGVVSPIRMLYVFTSDKGFCGAFNESLARMSQDFSATCMRDGRKAKVVVVGGRGLDVFKERSVPDVEERVENRGRLKFCDIAKLADAAYDDYTSGRVESVGIAYNSFKSMLVQSPMISTVLPFDLGGVDAKPEDMIIEPAVDIVKHEVCLNYLRSVFFDAFMQTTLGEVASRLITMRHATESSNDMINALKVKFNKARQAMITIELSEILSAFEMISEGEA